MIKLISQNGEKVYDIYEYVCDTPEDIEKLSKKCGMGSTCIIISTSEVYMLNSSKEWVKL